MPKVYGFKVFLSLFIGIIGLFAITSESSAIERSGSFEIRCSVDASPGGQYRGFDRDGRNDGDCEIDESLPGQMWRFEYRNVVNDNPAPGVWACINDSGILFDPAGICWIIQAKGSNQNIGQFDRTIDEQSGGFRSERWRTFVGKAATQSSVTNDNNYIGQFTYFSREVDIDNLDYTANPISVGGQTNLTWRTDFGFDQRVAYTDTDASTGEDNPGQSTGENNQRHSLLYRNENNTPGIADFTLRVWGPNSSGVYSEIRRDFPSLTVIGDMTGTLRGNYTTCTKSGSNNCDLVLDHTTSNATAAHIMKDLNDWRDIPTATVPAGTTIDANPSIGTHTYQLIGSNGGPFIALAQITVTVRPEDTGPPPGGPTCSPGFYQGTTGVPAPFSATGGNGSYTWTTSAGGSLSSNTGSNVTATFNTSGTHTVTARSNNLNHSCTFFIPGPTVNPVTCSPASQNIGVFSIATFTAGAGDGTFNWSVSPTTGANQTAFTGNPFQVQFTTTGTRTITVNSAGTSATCTVNVTAAGCTALTGPANGTVFPAGTTTTQFQFNTSAGRTNYILDLSTDPDGNSDGRLDWWWNNGTGSGGPGVYRAASPVSSTITVNLNEVNNNFYAGGRPVPTSLVNGTTYYWQVYAYDPSNQAASECRSGISSFRVDTNTPTMRIIYNPATLNPVVLTASGSICRRVNLSWTYNPDGVAQGFRVYRSPDGTLGSWQQLPIAAPANLSTAARSFSDTDPALIVGDDYYYRVDTYTNSAPPRFVSSNTGVATPVDCSANFNPSTYNIYQVNGGNYNPSSTVIRNGDSITFRVVITNFGPANGTGISASNVMSNNLVNFRNYTISKGTSVTTIGNITPTVSGDEQTMNMSLSGTKCVSPNNPTSCAPATDPSCATSAPAFCNNWILEFTATVDIQSTNNQDTIEGTTLLTYTDGTGTYVHPIEMPDHLFQTGNRLPPEFREVTP